MLLFLLVLTATAQKNPNEAASFRKLAWSDEFNYSGLPDPAKWNYEEGYVRNKELQYYTKERKENAVVENGFLVLTVRNDSLMVDGKLHPITSASLNTKGKGEWTYGRMEIRGKFSSALGTWPAIWMLGTNIDSIGWPASGEIDILEHVGYIPDTVHFNVHTKTFNHVNKNNKGAKLYSKAPDQSFHTYTLEWFPEKLDWYFDGRKVFTFVNDGTGSGAWPFDKPEYLLLNFAFGGAWGGQKGVDTSALPQQMLVDYVRVYQ
jgi:beta-glucanase (GH16 family)